MITTSDPAYNDTLEIKRGEKILPQISKLLIEWINNAFNVNAINIYFDTIIVDDRPRITVIFENFNDLDSFKVKGEVNYIKEKQKLIADKYIQLVKELKLEDSHQTENVFVCYSEFSHLYTSTIASQVAPDQMQDLFKLYKDSIIWQISLLGSSLIVFFYTNKEMNDPKNDILLAELNKAFFELIKPYDEFAYLQLRTIRKQSKEDFDTIYEGSWSKWMQYNL